MGGLQSLAKCLKKADDFLTRIEEAIVAALLFVMTMIIFIAVIERFFLHMGITWIEELARYISVWAAFIGSALAAKKGVHIGIEAFVQVLPPRAREFEALLVDIVGIAFAIVVFKVGMGFVLKLSSSNQFSPSLGINIAYVYAAAPVGCGLMGVHYFIKLITGIADFIQPAVCDEEGRA